MLLDGGALSLAGALEARLSFAACGASMMMVLVGVAVRPFWSVAT